MNVLGRDRNGEREIDESSEWYWLKNINYTYEVSLFAFDRIEIRNSKLIKFKILFDHDHKNVSK